MRYFRDYEFRHVVYIVFLESVSSIQNLLYLETEEVYCSASIISMGVCLLETWSDLTGVANCNSNR